MTLQLSVPRSSPILRSVSVIRSRRCAVRVPSWAQVTLTPVPAQAVVIESQTSRCLTMLPSSGAGHKIDDRPSQVKIRYVTPPAVAFLKIARCVQIGQQVEFSEMRATSDSTAKAATVCRSSLVPCGDSFLGPKARAFSLRPFCRAGQGGPGPHPTTTDFSTSGC
jgi:hypothetical protein